MLGSGQGKTWIILLQANYLANQGIEVVIMTTSKLVARQLYYDIKKHCGKNADALIKVHHVSGDYLNLDTMVHPKATIIFDEAD